jgi:hypothetical protein
MITFKSLDGKLMVLPYLFIAGAAVLRLSLICPYNLIPVFSCLLFFGACRPRREYCFPLLALVGVDILLTTHQYGFALTAGHAVTWIWYLLALFLGGAVLGMSISARRVLGSSLFASLSFFVVSNLAVWFEWGMYPKTLGGLEACFSAALPFFRNSITSEVIGSAMIFTLGHHIQRFMPAAHVRAQVFDSGKFGLEE